MGDFLVFGEMVMDTLVEYPRLFKILLLLQLGDHYLTISGLRLSCKLLLLRWHFLQAKSFGLGFVVFISIILLFCSSVAHLCQLVGFSIVSTRFGELHGHAIILASALFLGDLFLTLAHLVAFLFLGHLVWLSACSFGNLGCFGQAS